MTALNVRLPDYLLNNLQELARREGISADQFVTLAVAEKMSALMTEQYFEERAKLATREKYEAALASVVDAEPEPYDRTEGEVKH
jgi:hypothetical protein